MKKTVSDRGKFTEPSDLTSDLCDNRKTARIRSSSKLTCIKQSYTCKLCQFLTLFERLQSKSDLSNKRISFVFWSQRLHHKKMRCKNGVCSQLYDTIVGWWSMFRTAYNTFMHFIFPLTPVILHLLRNINFSTKYFVNCTVYTGACGIK